MAKYKKKFRDALSVARYSRGRVGQSLLMALAGSLVFTAVLLYSRPADPIPQTLLRAVHAWSGDRMADAVGVGQPAAAAGTHLGPKHPSGGPPVNAVGVNSFAPSWGGLRPSPGSGSGSSIGVPASAAARTSDGTGGTITGGAGGEIASSESGPSGDASHAAEAQLAKVAAGLSAGASGGVRVDQGLPSSVAGKLGLQTGDVIIAVNGSPINTPEEFAKLYERDGLPGQVEAIRDGRTIHLHH